MRWKGQGGKYNSRQAYYHDRHLHVQCPEQVRHLCDLCRVHFHKHDAPIKQRRACLVCQEREAAMPNWYQSQGEAETAWRLDISLMRHEIVFWRRARPVTLQPAIAGVQRAITYCPDFVVVEKDGTVALEVKGASCKCRACNPGKRLKRQVIADDALLKIKWYRALAAEKGWPPLRVIDKKGEPIHV